MSIFLIKLKLLFFKMKIFLMSKIKRIKYVECIEIAKNKFKNDYKILAITIRENNITYWKIVDLFLSEELENKQYSLNVNGKNESAAKHNYNEILIYNTETKKEKIINKENINNYKNYRILSVRGALRGQPIWKIQDNNLKNLLKDRLVSIRHAEEEIVANDYREGVFIMKHKITKRILILWCESYKIAMKKS